MIANTIPRRSVLIHIDPIIVIGPICTDSVPDNHGQFRKGIDTIISCPSSIRHNGIISQLVIDGECTNKDAIIRSS